jgi:deoxyadenosine/deoxycytidine kinase
MIMIVNIYGGPGVGKSTVAASLFAHLNREYAGSKSVELVTEYAKALTWENRQTALMNQLYVTGKQFHNIHRVVNAGVDVVVTDSPMLLGCCYAKKYCPHYPDSFQVMAKDFNDMLGPALNIVIARKQDYIGIGRNESCAEAIEMDGAIANMLYAYDYTFHLVEANGTETDVEIESLLSTAQKLK